MAVPLVCVSEAYSDWTSLYGHGVAYSRGFQSGAWGRLGGRERMPGGPWQIGRENIVL